MRIRSSGAIRRRTPTRSPRTFTAGAAWAQSTSTARVRAQEGMPAGGRLAIPDGFVDRELVVIRIDDAQGKPFAVLVNFQCHGTVLAYENNTFAGLDRHDAQGGGASAAGRDVPLLPGRGRNQGPIEGFTGDLEVAHRLGATLGLQAAALALGIETVGGRPRFEGFVESTAYQPNSPGESKGHATRP